MQQVKNIHASRQVLMRTILTLVGLGKDWWVGYGSASGGGGSLILPAKRIARPRFLNSNSACLSKLQRFGVALACVRRMD